MFRLKLKIEGIPCPHLLSACQKVIGCQTILQTCIGGYIKEIIRREKVITSWIELRIIIYINLPRNIWSFRLIAKAFSQVILVWVFDTIGVSSTLTSNFYTPNVIRKKLKGKKSRRNFSFLKQKYSLNICKSLLFTRKIG